MPNGINWRQTRESYAAIPLAHMSTAMTIVRAIPSKKTSHPGTLKSLLTKPLNMNLSALRLSRKVACSTSNGNS